MSYLESGFNKFLYKTELPSAPIESTEDTTSQTIPLLSGNAISGGTTRSATGKIQIDWELGQILIGDGANWRVLIGEDGL